MGLQRPLPRGRRPSALTATADEAPRPIPSFVGALVVAVLDIGSEAKTGWWRSHADGAETEGRRVDDLCTAIVQDLAAGRAVALGFEAPLWVPFAASANQLGKARPGEPMSWSAAPGATVLAYGIQQATYVLHRLATGGAPPKTTLAPAQLRAGQSQLLVWEAFVSGKAKDRSAAQPHISDARAAAIEFRRRWDTGVVNSDIGHVPAISIAGLALHVSGLASNPDLLTTAPIVVPRPPPRRTDVTAAGAEPRPNPALRTNRPRPGRGPSNALKNGAMRRKTSTQVNASPSV